jgi:hypothetical protein
MDDHLRVIYGRLNQHYGHFLADRAVMRIMLGLMAVQNPDWRGAIETFALWRIQPGQHHLTWGRTVEEKMEIVAQADESWPRALTTSTQLFWKREQGKNRH